MHFGNQVAVTEELTLVVLVAAKTDIMRHVRRENAEMSHLRVTCYFRLTEYMPRPAMKRESRRVFSQQ